MLGHLAGVSQGLQPLSTARQDLNRSPFYDVISHTMLEPPEAFLCCMQPVYLGTKGGWTISQSWLSLRLSMEDGPMVIQQWSHASRRFTRSPRMVTKVVIQLTHKARPILGQFTD